jgi:hypothetical protein
MSPSSIIQGPDYESWMRLFGDHTLHVLVGEGSCCPHTAFQASTLYTAKLHKLFPEVFSSLSLSEGEAEGLPCWIDAGKNPLVSAYPGLTFNLLPRRLRGIEPLTINQTVVSRPEDSTLALRGWVEQEVETFWHELGGDDPSSTLSTVLAKAIEFRSQTLAMATTSDSLAPDLICDENSIVFLGTPPFPHPLDGGSGTGCAQPSKYRNVSGIFVQVTIPLLSTAHGSSARWRSDTTGLW